MHQLATIPDKPSIAAVRALVREESSSLLDGVTDDQIDAAIKRDIDRPAATINLLAGSAIATLELPVIADKLRQAVSDGSALDYAPADDKAMRWYHKISAPPCNEPWLVKAHEAAANQPFLARRLLTAACEIVLDADTKFNAHDQALAVRMALFAMATSLFAVAESVIEAMSPDEWSELLAARKDCWEENERVRIAAMHAAA